MAKRVAIVCILLGVIFGGLLAWRLFMNNMIRQFFSQPMPPVVVSTMKITPQAWQDYLSATGDLLAQDAVDIVPEVGGKVVQIHFHSGDLVKKGQPLIDLDDSLEQSALLSDEANLTLAEANLKRLEKLYASEVISKVDYETAEAKFTQAKAAVEHDRALVKQKHLTAPFDGKLGLRQVNLGQIVSPSSGSLVNLQKLDPLELSLSLPQQAISQLKMGQEVLFAVDTYPNKAFKGTISALQPGLNPDTRMLSLRVFIPNPQHQLYPGMYGEAKILLKPLDGAVVIPQTAVEYSLYGDTVYVVKQMDGKQVAKKQSVQLGQRRGENVVVQKGLAIGDEVITAGQIKLFDNAPVTLRQAEEKSRE